MVPQQEEQLAVMDDESDRSQVVPVQAVQFLLGVLGWDADWEQLALPLQPLLQSHQGGAIDVFNCDFVLKCLV